MLSYVDVKDKSAADLHKRLDQLGDEFVRHMGKLSTDAVFTQGLMSRESEKVKIAGRFRSVLRLEVETDQILSMKIDTLKKLLSKKFLNISIADIVKFARSLPGDIHFPKRAERLLKVPLIEYFEYSNFNTNWRDITDTPLVIISKFGPSVYCRRSSLS